MVKQNERSKRNRRAEKRFKVKERKTGGRIQTGKIDRQQKSGRVGGGGATKEKIEISCHVPFS
jgi:hypothetical protein